MRLVLLTRDHAAAVRELSRDPDVQRFTRVPRNAPIAWIERYEAGRLDGTREAFAILDGDTFVGAAVAAAIDQATHTVELGYMVMPNERGRRIGTQALELLTAWAKTDLGATRIELVITRENVASKRVAERCGYVVAGERDGGELWLLGSPGA